MSVAGCCHVCGSDVPHSAAQVPGWPVNYAASTGFARKVHPAVLQIFRLDQYVIAAGYNQSAFLSKWSVVVCS